ncbi:acetate/propionate family kinase [Pelagicoccus sp. SDUM812003]|uniref:acetate/propionate family kinase n=1 Tax=Pelagicoccus sp. SDUM812003 TaxID=3041267 RepID=UPI0028107664|nr:acetate/propionate family kinase [Pelagicoccus sp. SDUM812003]MDQ8204634.1 acetate/propionate family kinase [Pelagicoccus sp. SDUM812003]
MKILVANIGSTSLKYRLYSMNEDGAELLCSGGYERVEDYASTIESCLQALQESGHLKNLEELSAVGFKTVLGKDLSGCVFADDAVIAALEGFKEVAPAHNIPYANGIKQFRSALPNTPLVALFETAFYQFAPEASRSYAIPEEWQAIGIRRYGFHGASHKFIAERSAQLLGREDVSKVAQSLYQKGPQPPEGADLRVISCHLGGSSSVTGIRNGVAIGTSMGFSPQSGLPQNNRVGDLDSAAIPYAMKKLGLSLEEVEKQLTKQSGLLGVSGVSNDVRDIGQAAKQGNKRAQLALDVLAHSIRHWIGAFYLELGGCDALVFTAGIGENDTALREAVCSNLDGLGFELDLEANASLRGKEGDIASKGSKTRVLVIPANEELVVARECYRLLQSGAKD